MFSHIPSGTAERAMHHKRGRPRSSRAGCKMCKPWKVNGYPTERYDGEKFSDHVRRHTAAHAVAEHRVLEYDNAPQTKEAENQEQVAGAVSPWQP